MEEIFDVIIDAVRPAEGGPVERNINRAGRVLRGAVEGAAAKGAGPVTLVARGADYALAQAGVDEDALIRRQLHREVADVDKYGGFGVREVEPFDGPPAADGATPADAPGGAGRGTERTVSGVIDP